MGLKEMLQPRGLNIRLPWQRKSVASIWSNWKTWNVLVGEGGLSELSRDYYEKNALVFACVEELATSASEPELVVDVKKAKGWEKAEDHALAELLRRPNAVMTGYEMWHSVMMYQCIEGNMYFEKERSGSGRVVALWPIRPDRIKARLGGEGKRKQMVAWDVTFSEGLQEALGPNDVIHFKTSHPRSEIYGLAPLSIIAQMAGLDNTLTDYVAAFFKNGAVPYGLLITKHAIDEAEVARIKSRFKEQFIGEEGWHNLMVLDDVEAQYQQVAALPKDLEMPAIRAVAEERICAVFQVPPILVGALVGLEHGTYSNYEQARRSFWQETLTAKYRRHADVLNLYLTPDFGDNVRVRWDFSNVKALQEETDKLHNRVRSNFTAGYITVNEARTEIGFDPVAAGDIFLRPMNLIPESAKPATGKVLLAPVAVKGGGDDKRIGDLKDIWWKALDRTAQSWERPFREAAQGRFEDDETAILAILRREGKKSKEAVAFQIFGHTVLEYLENEARDSWRDVFIPLFTSVVDAQGVNIAAAWGIEFDIDRPEVQAFLREYAMRFSERMFAVDAASISGIVAKAQGEGWSVPQIRDSILETWETYDRVRAEMIARTETIRSSNAGAKEAMRTAGIKVIRWLATRDARVCPFCEELGRNGGKAIEVMGDFFKQGDEFTVTDSEGKVYSMRIDYADVGYPPLHTDCRCTIIAEFQEV